MTTAPVRMIQATADTTFNTPSYLRGTFRGSLEGLKRAFGLPNWITRSIPKEQTVLNTATAHNAYPVAPVVTSHGGTPFFVIKSPAQKQLDRVRAHMNLTELNKPFKPNTSTRILNLLETRPILHLTDMNAALPDVSPSGISSRCSELVKAGLLVALGKGEYTLAQSQTLYFCPISQPILTTRKENPCLNPSYSARK